VGFSRIVSSFRSRLRREASAQVLYFVHIGKCGGSSLRRAVSKSRIVKNRFVGVQRFHFEKPIPNAKASYLFAVRNPIDRAISAFNYRRESIRRGGEEKHPGEREVFNSYPTLNELAEAVISNGHVNEGVFESWNRVHHLGDESIAFYLEDLMPTLSKEQVFGIVSVERFNEDSQRLLGVSPGHRRNNRKNVPDADLALSTLGRQNLSTLLERDFELLEQLLDLVGASHQKKKLLLQR